VVLLSEAFINEYFNYAELNDKSKFVVIPNALSYDDFLLLNKLYEKKKQVLVVSRLEEAQKRISLVIKAWDTIMRNEENERMRNEWSLKIVGTGDSEKDYKRLAQELNIHNIEFCGRQQPKTYYEDSSIFLMTSSYEGWGLTLTEAQQFGCVPIAFDSYSSIHDIITDGKNGLLIKDNDLNLFVRKMKKLMTSESLRIKMAQNAIRSSEQFALHKIINLWENLLK
jgi:glycosyltransferase involved in cell wall biosynthesis